MTKAIYRTATSLTGHIADEANSLDWLDAVEGGDDDFDGFMAGVGVLVEGSTTYEWVLGETNVCDEPRRWQEFYGDRPTFVFTTRDLPVPLGADVRFVSGDVLDAWPAIVEAAAGKAVWVTGGGDLAGQFFDVDLLDEVVVTIAPVALTGGAPLLPRRIEAHRLRLRHAERRGQFVHVEYEVLKGA